MFFRKKRRSNFSNFVYSLQYILKYTGMEKISMIGFSQGSAQIFGALSHMPDLSKHISLFIALAPTTHIYHLSFHPLVCFSVVFCLISLFSLLILSICIHFSLIIHSFTHSLIHSFISFLFYLLIMSCEGRRSDTRTTTIDILYVRTKSICFKYPLLAQKTESISLCQSKRSNK
jgi:hypothetical protein